MFIRPKWILLQLTSVLCFLTVFPMILSAVPLAIIRLEAERRAYYAMNVASIVLLSLYFGVMKAEGTALIASYFIIIFWGSLAAELLIKFYSKNSQQEKKINFWNYYLLLSLIPLIFLMLFTFYKFGSLNLEKIFPIVESFAQKTIEDPASKEIIAELKKSSAPEATEALRLLESPSKFASQIMFMIPTYMLATYFIVGFFTIFFLGRGQAFFEQSLRSNWIKEVILDFKNHDIMILGALIALVWNLFYSKFPLSPFWMEHGPLIGSGLITFFGVFFFFQGLMCLLHLFNLWGIKGFIGSIIIFVVLFMALKLVAILGLIDMWMDFRSKNFYLKIDNNKSN